MIIVIRNIYFTFLLLVLYAGIISCSFSKKKSDEQVKEEFARELGIPKMQETTSADTRHVAVVSGANSFLEIQFKQGNTKLSEQSKNEIREWLQILNKKGEVQEVKIIGWSDTEYPDKNLKVLSKKEKELASSRVESIISETEKYYKSAFGDLPTIQKYNMAIRPNAIEDILKLSDSRVKKSFEEAIEGFQSNKEISKASRAVLLTHVKVAKK